MNETISQKRIEEYWYLKLSDSIPQVPYAVATASPVIDRCVSPMDTEVYASVSKIAKGDALGVYVIYLSAFVVLLKKYFGLSELIVTGNPTGGEVSSRPLFYRLHVHDEVTLRALVSQVRQEVLTAADNANYSYAELSSRFKDRNISEDSLWFFGLNTAGASAIRQASLSLDISTAPDGKCNVVLQSSKEKFANYDLSRFAHQFTFLLENFRSHIDTPLKDIEILSADERSFLLDKFNNTAVQLPSRHSIHHLFEQQAARTPDHLALFYEGQDWTYKRLSEQSNKLAAYLREKLKVGRGELVGIMLDRSDLTVVSILAVLKAGAAYVPLDVSSPEKRLAYILGDTNPKAVITSSGYLSELSDFNRGLCAIDIQLDTLPSVDYTSQADDPDDVAYVIYTSGSTGNPKGVVMSHKAVVNFILGQQQVIYDDYRGHLNIAVIASFGFDPSVQQMFGTLFFGHSLFIVPDETKNSSRELWSYLRENGIEAMDCTPTLFGLLVSESAIDVQGVCLKYVIIGGEPLHSYKLQRFYDLLGSHALPKVTNVYGPTECCVNSTYCNIEAHNLRSNVISIGVPLPNYKVYVLDRNLRLVPRGVPGELCVGGASVGLGYWQRPDFTSEKFVADPFLPADPSARLYRTGDVCRINADGLLEFIGRTDLQVKVRGYRIELDEVATAVSRIDGVTSVHVSVRSNGGEDKFLVAYYSSDSPLSADFIRSTLAENLPVYMLPSYYVKVDIMPTNQSGKVDEERLPSPLDTLSEYVEPSSPLEKLLTDNFAQVMGREYVNATDNFFEIGGDSIIAIRAVSLINKALNVSIAVKDIFEHQTVQMLASFIENSAVVNSDRADIALSAQSIAELKHAIVSDEKLRDQLPAGWEDIYPMSDIEAGIAFHYLLNPEYGIYHDLQYSQLIDRNFVFDDFARAFALMVKKHTILRTSFAFQHFAAPMQIVHKVDGLKWDISYEDISHLGSDERKTYLQGFAVEDRRRAFDLSRPCLFRMKVFRLSASEVSLLWISHHAIIDGWSSASLMTELSNVYYSLKIQKTYEPAPLAISYKDFVIFQDAYKRNPEVRQFWRHELNGYQRPPLPLSKDFKTVDLNGELDSHTFQLPSPSREALSEFASKEKLNIKSVYLAAFFYLIRYTSDVSDITVGVVTHARPEIEDGDKLVGCFVNTIPVRVELPAMAANDFVRSFNGKLNKLKRYDQLSLLEITKLGGHTSSSVNPIYDILFNFVDFHIYKDRHKSVTLTTPLVENYTGTNLPFNFEVNVTEEVTTCLITAQPSLYSQGELQRLGGYYTRILEHLVSCGAQELTADKVMGIQERDRLMSLGIGKKFTYTDDQTVVSLFEHQVKQTPGCVAVVFEDRQITYDELNQYANKIAWHLIGTHGIKREDRVAVMAGPSIDFVAAMLGVMKSGGVYCPIDMNLPYERRRRYVENAGVKLMLSNATGVAEKFNVVDITIDEIAAGSGKTENPGLAHSWKDLCYIIYTSGTTGQPNGVMIQHGSFYNLVNWYNRSQEFTSLSRSFLVLPIGFDASIKEIASPLVTGGCIVTSQQIHFDPYSIARKLQRHKINFFNASPSAFNQILLAARQDNYEQLKWIKRIALGGEMLTQGAIGHFLDHSDCIISNVYGPTEAGDIATSFAVDKSEVKKYSKLPVGAPIDNAEVYIFDKHMQLSVFGAEGEMYLGGVGVGRGYMDKPEMTQRKFIHSPFDGKMILYKTGDRAKYLENEQIAFVGRVDDQLKIRGNRVSLKEIQATLKSHESVSEAVVLARKDEESNPHIVAYVSSHVEIDQGDLRQYLRNQLPAYMVPRYFVLLKKFPLTVNGKIDSGALPDPVEHAPVVVPSSDTDALTRNLLSIFATVLALEHVGENDNFFEIGGDSIKAIQVVARMRSLGLALEIKDLYHAPTVAAIRSSASQLKTFIDQSPVEGIVPLTPIQARFFYGSNVDHHHFNNAFLIRFPNRVSVVAVRSIVSFIQTHHDALRMTFRWEGESVVQVNNGVDFPVEARSYDLTLSKDPMREADQLAGELQASISLEKGPLFKAAVFTFEKYDYLLLVIHHLVVDNVSWNILKEDIFTLLQQQEAGLPFQLPHKTHSFKAWSENLLTYAGSGAIEQVEQYWQHLHSNELRRIPADFPDGTNLVVDASAVTVRLDSDLTRSLVSAGRKNTGIDLNDILLTALVISVDELYGFKEMVVAFEGHGREQIVEGLNITRTVGWFTSIYPVKLERKSGVQSLTSQIEDTHTLLKGIPENGLSYGLWLASTGGWKKEKTPQISYNFFGNVDGNALPAGMELSTDFGGPEESSKRIRSFEIIIMGAITSGQLVISIEYSAKQFKMETIDRLGKTLERNLATIAGQGLSQAKGEAEVSPDFAGVSWADLGKVSEIFNSGN